PASAAAFRRGRDEEHLIEDSWLLQLSSKLAILAGRFAKRLMFSDICFHRPGLASGVAPGGAKHK
ncbi:MAG TPA: hypothetical protein VL002_11940, partial [Candidimonas sp.]|nr:hypothetical protein [Candidimonas sp.]